MKGIRAFGKNEGDLGHTGDFELLFQPVLDTLAPLAVFGANLHFNPWLDTEDEDEASRLDDVFTAELDRLSLITTSSTDVPYYGPSFFPRCARHIVDDWNDILCFYAPFPDYLGIKEVVYSNEQVRALETRDYSRLQELFLSLGFAFYFRNIDACFWECYAHDELHIENIRKHLEEKGIDFENLIFTDDYPYGGLKKERAFKGIHKI